MSKTKKEKKVSEDVSMVSSASKTKKVKKEKKEKTKKKEKKQKKRSRSDSQCSVTSSEEKREKKKQRKEKRDKSEKVLDEIKPAAAIQVVDGDEKIVQTSALDFTKAPMENCHDITLLLFYQYVEPPWDNDTYQMALQHMQHLGDSLQLSGRMRVAKEGLNCTLTGTHDHILGYCKALREFHNGEFADTEFKLTKDLPKQQAFPNLKVMPVIELVHYGLEGEKAPPISYTGVHLQPDDYHQKLAENETVVIDVRNHYEAAIGHFRPPGEGAKWLDPKMRKSTEFPIWLDKTDTKEQLRGKQVLMYCTGGVRCERASALLKYKMETDPDIKELGIKGVFQLQGGIDKYFKQFPDGGFWAGKNYTFDKRFAHAPPKVEGELRSGAPTEEVKEEIMGKCEACNKPWDMYRGKRRCPTCGVPSLICRDCFQADKDGTRKLDRRVRCELCVEENVNSKSQLKQREDQDVKEYKAKLAEKGITIERTTVDRSRPQFFKAAPNPDGVTRLLLKNMCSKNMDEATLTEALPGITHIMWKTDRTTGNFFGSGWVEMATPEDAARAVGMNGKRVLGRPLYVSYQPPDGKDVWPPPSTAIKK